MPDDCFCVHSLTVILRRGDANNRLRESLGITDNVYREIDIHRFFSVPADKQSAGIIPGSDPAFLHIVELGIEIHELFRLAAILLIRPEPQVCVGNPTTNYVLRLQNRFAPLCLALHLTKAGKAAFYLLVHRLHPARSILKQFVIMELSVFSMIVVMKLFERNVQVNAKLYGIYQYQLGRAVITVSAGRNISRRQNSKLVIIPQAFDIDVGQFG